MDNYNFKTTIVWPPIPKQSPEIEEKVRAQMAKMMDEKWRAPLGVVANPKIEPCPNNPTSTVCNCRTVFHTATCPFGVTS